MGHPLLPPPSSATWIRLPWVRRERIFLRGILPSRLQSNLHTDALAFPAPMSMRWLTLSKLGSCSGSLAPMQSSQPRNQRSRLFQERHRNFLSSSAQRHWRCRSSSGDLIVGEFDCLTPHLDLELMVTSFVASIFRELC